MRQILTEASIHNAMAVHAAFGGSTNLLLHIPAIAHAAKLPRPTVADWIAINRKVPRLVDVLPNGPTHHPTVRAFLAGGVPEVMLHLRKLGLLKLEALTVTGQPLGEVLDWWEKSERRQRFKDVLQQQDGIAPDDVIMSPEQARARGLTSRRRPAPHPHAAIPSEMSTSRMDEDSKLPVAPRSSPAIWRWKRACAASCTHCPRH